MCVSNAQSATWNKTNPGFDLLSLFASVATAAFAAASLLLKLSLAFSSVLRDDGDFLLLLRNLLGGPA